MTALLLAPLVLAGATSETQFPEDVPPPPPPPVVGDVLPPSAGPEAAGTGVIAGRVLDARTGSPVPGALVNLRSSRTERIDVLQSRGLITQAAVVRPSAGDPAVMTDGQGRFVFSGLPAGTFDLTVERSGFISGAHGRRSVDGPARPLTLDAGELATDVSVLLWRQAVITGRVVDEVGEPAVSVMVRAVRVRSAAGGIRYQIAGTATTDDRGIYRLSNLVPGTYLVAVPAVVTAAPVSVVGLREQATRSGDASAFLNRARETGASTAAMMSGLQMGDLYVSGRGARTAPSVAERDGQLFAARTVFYPAAAGPSDAEPVAVGSGEERSGIDLQQPWLPATSVSGFVIGPDGPASLHGVELVPADLQGFSSQNGFETGITITDMAGAFTFPVVPAGQYFVSVSRIPRPGPQMVTTVRVGNVVSSTVRAVQLDPSTADPPLAAEAAIVVGTAPVDGILLTLEAAGHVSGQVEGRDAGAAATVVQQVALRLVPVSGLGLPFPTAPVQPSDTGSFEIGGYPTGRYRLSAAPPPGWFVESATMNGRDVLEVPFDLGPRDLTGVVVTVSDRPAEVSGSVRASLGAESSEALVILFPADYQEYIANDMPPRRSWSGLTDEDGAFRVPRLPPGDYLVVALSADEDVNVYDAATVTRLAAVAATVTAPAGGTTSITLTLASTSGR